MVKKLKKDKTKDILKIFRSLENRGILLKATNRKITSQERKFLNFLRSLMSAGLPLMKRVLTPLTRSVLLPLGPTAGMAATDALFKSYSGTTALIISNEKELKNTGSKELNSKRTKRQISPNVIGYISC